MLFTAFVVIKFVASATFMVRHTLYRPFTPTLQKSTRQ